MLCWMRSKQPSTSLPPQFSGERAFHMTFRRERKGTRWSPGTTLTVKLPEIMHCSLKAMLTVELCALMHLQMPGTYHIILKGVQVLLKPWQ